ELRRAVEAVEAGRLDPVERRAVEPGKRGDARRAAGVEPLEEGQALPQVRAGPLRLERHQLAPGGRGAAGRDLVLAHAEALELVLRQIDAAELPVLAHVADDVDELE